MLFIIYHSVVFNGKAIANYYLQKKRNYIYIVDDGLKNMNSTNRTLTRKRMR